MSEQQPSTLVIAIDGPSGSGKSSTAKGVARRLGLAFLDTGSMYRACAWQAAEDGVSEAADLVALARAADLEVGTDPDDARVRMNGTDVTEAIRLPQISAEVSKVAVVPEVRVELVRRQREIVADTLAGGRGIVLEGRDTTTVVTPEADVRVLLVADPGARVARRHAELGEVVDVAAVSDQVIRRDRDDSTVAAFTEAADGVVVVDSTELTLEQVVDAVVALAGKVHV
ncbi:(d)CMP kinase [Desertihabitans aurantiacus]|uniref:(d)CMP kinase n=1 Tax=Desertihabitans aurantiacus TaxID=2282477 RepID=UPI001E2F54C0|nr:(d)CMP kinase [Desertihabitans aurantiacus]